MSKAAPKKYDHVIHPYLFVLKEGTEIQNNFLDYSLLLFLVNQADILHSPTREHKLSTPVIHLLKK